jgi:KDO2-lipid IV(A) lauroyltransferase
MKSERWNKRVQHQIEYIALLGVLLIIWLASLKTVIKMAEFLGWFFFSVLRLRRKVTLQNLERAFPEKTPEERLEIARRTYKNFAKMTLEYMRFPVYKKGEILSLCRIEDLEQIDRVLENGKGGVLLAGHFGNWELMGAAVAQKGYPVSYLVGEQHNKKVDDRMNSCRTLMGVGIIHMGVSVRGVIKALRKNEIIGLLSDQDAGREGVFVDFFGIPSSTHQGPAAFALKTGAPIIFGTTIHLPHGRHRLVYELLTFDHLNGVTPENIREVTQAYSSLLERWIRRYPDHWFWMHRRWKSRPSNTEQ